MRRFTSVVFVDKLWVTLCIPCGLCGFTLAAQEFRSFSGNSPTAPFHGLKDVNAVQSGFCRLAERGFESHAACGFKRNAQLGKVVLKFGIGFAVSDHDNMVNPKDCGTFFALAAHSH